MRIKNIRGTNFTGYRHFDITLPERGIVLIQGKNGSGKSSIVDGVSAAGWGRSIRTKPERPWWREGRNSAIAVTTYDDLEFTRSRSNKNKLNISWTRAGVLTQPDTVTKGQPDLDRLIGEYLTWKSTHVFSSRDAQRFSSITDAERKRLLETFLGNGVLDAASKLVRVDLRAVTSEFEIRKNKLEIIHDRMTSLKSELEMAQEFVASMPAPITDEELAEREQWHTLREAVKAKHANFKKANEKHRATLNEPRPAFIADLELKAREKDGEYKRALVGECTNCHRPWEDAPDPEICKVDHATAAAAAKKADEDWKAGRAKVQNNIRQNEEKIAEFAAQLSGLDQQIRTFEAREISIKAHAPRKAELLTRITELTTDVGLAEEEYEDTLTLCGQTERNQAVLSLVDKTLGLSGIRTVLLGRTLTAIEQLSNLALYHLSAGVAKLTLRAYTEGKGGKISDAIALGVTGWADDKGYDSLSDGQQRDVDLSLLIGTGLVAEAAHGAPNGTLFFDEALDALDRETAALAGTLIAELAETRCCVIVTHTDKVVDSIRPVVVLHIEDGKILEL